MDETGAVPLFTTYRSSRALQVRSLLEDAYADGVFASSHEAALDAENARIQAEQDAASRVEQERQRHETLENDAADEIQRLREENALLRKQHGEHEAELGELLIELARAKNSASAIPLSLTPEQDINRSAEAERVLVTPVFKEACNRIDAEFRMQRERVPLNDSDMHTRLVIAEQLWGKMLDHLRSLMMKGAYAKEQLKLRETRTEKMAQAIRRGIRI
jgi:hypothetical protein